MDLRERPTHLTTRHPWETVRARFFCRVLVPAVARRPVDIVDLGAGDGFVAERVLATASSGSTMTCVDSHYTSSDLALLRSGAPVGIAYERECPARELDVAILLDVLEHIADDEDFLRSFVARHVRPRGAVLVSVPAHQVLYTQHDVSLGHHRRYSLRDLNHVVERAGLQIQTAGSLFGSLLVPRAIEKTLERARGIRSSPSINGMESEVTTGLTTWNHGRFVTGVVTAALELDARMGELAARFSAPSAGLSVWALCERRTP